MVRIRQTGFLKINFETMQKNAFSGFCQKFLQAMDEDGNFFCQFPNSWALRVSWVVIPQNLIKAKITAP
jgi:hypothetical protein